MQCSPSLIGREPVRFVRENFGRISGRSGYPTKKRRTMDSLITSAIALAAGGWDKVKLVGMYNAITASIPSWKIGFFQSLSNNLTASSILSTGVTCAYNAPFIALIIPGSIIENGGRLTTSGGSVNSIMTMGSGTLTFNDTSIAAKTFNLKWCAILFKW